MSPLRSCLVALCVFAGGHVACAAGSATDTVAFAAPVDNSVRPLVALIGAVSRDGTITTVCSVLGAARVEPVPVAGSVSVTVSPLDPGQDVEDTLDSVGQALCEKVTWRVPLAGGRAECLPAYGFPSPSGKRYAYWVQAPDGGRRLYVRDAEGEEPADLYLGDDYGHVRWSPDEALMAVNGFPVPNHRGNQITVVEAEMGDVVYEVLKAYDACWSPDGGELAYLRAVMEGGKPVGKALEVWDRRTGEIIPLASLPRGACSLAYSPDGGSLLYGVDRWTPKVDRGGEVWVVARADGRTRKVYENASAPPTPLAWTTDGDACWLRVGEDRLALLSLASEPPDKVLELTMTPGKLPRTADAGALTEAAECARGALARVARANKAIGDLCDDLAGPRQELMAAVRELAELPAACAKARLLPEQCSAYAEALGVKVECLPLVACLARMERLAAALGGRATRDNTLPAAGRLPAELSKDPRLWSSPGSMPGERLQIRYCVEQAGPPTQGQLLLECGPFGNRMIRVRWPTEATETSGRYVARPAPCVEAVE